MRKQIRRSGKTVMISLLLILVMIVPYTVSAGMEPAADRETDTPFLDVDGGQWFAQAVRYVFDHGLMNGVGDESFDPDGTVSRGMAVTVLYRMEQKPEPDAGIAAETLFKDVPAGRYFTEAVRWAASGAIVEGYGGQLFGPFDNITREQLAKVLYKYADSMEYDMGSPAESLEAFTDRDEVSAWAEEAMLWAVGTGILQGDADRLLPGDTLSRKQLAQVLQRLDAKLTLIRENAGDDSGSDDEDGPGTGGADQEPASGGGADSGGSDETSDLTGSFADNMAALMPKDKNWSLSPYSLEMCMAMFANGTKGDTREEFLRALQIRDLDEYNSRARDLLDSYDTFQTVMNLETANSIWLNQTEFDGKGAFLDSFRDVLQLYYRAEAREVTSLNSVESINAWAKEKTHGLIERIAEEENRNFATAVANALYFKAAWALPFGKESTSDQTFFNQDGTESVVPFMHQLEHFGYYEDGTVRGVKMDYSNSTTDVKTGKIRFACEDADFSMYILMSDEEIDVQELLDRAEFDSMKVNLRIPRFKIEYGGALDNELKTLGIRTVYDPALADLSGMVDPELLDGRNLYLDTVVQKASVIVDEAGTEAAAVTVMFTKRNTTAVDTEPVVDFTANRPFWFAIRDNTSGQILFMGKYNQAAQ